MAVDGQADADWLRWWTLDGANGAKVVANEDEARDVQWTD
jgi:hypothetical protein